jgi:hypothetical protein
MWRRVLCIFPVVVGSFASTIPAANAAVPWTWPVVGPIIRGFDPPDDPYGAGHRGIDIAADLSTVIVAPDAGVVTFAGKVGGRLFLTIDHGGGVSSTCSWLNAVMVHRGDHVVRGQPVALTGWGHPDEPVPHLHFGVRLNGTYVDPLAYLGSPPVADLIRLAPLESAAPATRVTRTAASRMTGLAYPTMAGAPRARGSGGARGPGERGARVAGRHVVAVPRRRGAQRPRSRWHARTALRGVVACRSGHR